MVLAKAVVQAMLWTVAGAVMSTISFVVSQLILDGRHVGISMTYPGAFTAVLGATLVAPVCALTGLGLGVLIRNTAGTIVTSVVLLQLLQPFLSPTQPFSAVLNHAMILSAWLRLTENAGPPAIASYPYAPLSEC